MADDIYTLAHTGAQTDDLLGKEDTTTARVISHTGADGWEITRWSNNRVEMVKRIQTDIACTKPLQTGLYGLENPVEVTLPPGHITSIMGIYITVLAGSTYLLNGQISGFDSAAGTFSWSVVSSWQNTFTDRYVFFRIIGWNTGGNT